MDQQPAGVLPHLVPGRGPVGSYPSGDAGQLILAFLDQLLVDIGVHDEITFRSEGGRGFAVRRQAGGGSPLSGSALSGSALDSVLGTAIG